MQRFVDLIRPFVSVQSYVVFSAQLQRIKLLMRVGLVAVLMMILSVAIPFAVQPKHTISYASPELAVQPVNQPIFNTEIDETPKPPAPPAPAPAVAKSPSKPALKPVTGTKNEQLQATIDNWIATHGGVVTVAVRGITDPSIRASNKGTKQMATASIYKMFEILLTYSRINKGEWSANQGGLNIDNCVERMIVVSDNNCAVSIGGLLGWQATDSEIHGLGYVGSSLNINHPYSTANDVAKLMVDLETSATPLNATQRNAVLGFMKRQIYRSGIPAGNKGFDVANKVGFYASVNTDGGVVYGPKGTYAVAILTSGTSFSNIADLSAAIAAIMNQ